MDGAMRVFLFCAGVVGAWLAVCGLLYLLLAWHDYRIAKRYNKSGGK